MAIKQIYHIEVDEGSDTSTRFFYSNGSTGLPVDLTGYRAEMQVKQNYDGAHSPIVLLTYTSDIGGGIVLGTQGTVDLFISYVDTTNTLWDKAIYDLYLYPPVGARNKFVKGFFTIIKSVTSYTLV